MKIQTTWNVIEKDGILKILRYSKDEIEVNYDYQFGIEIDDDGKGMPVVIMPDGDEISLGKLAWFYRNYQDYEL